MKDMNKAINHNSSHQKPIKKVVSAIHTHKMSNRKLSIKKWSRYSTRASDRSGYVGDFFFKVFAHCLVHTPFLSW